jgi:Trypsin-co-occurring domain 1
VHVDYQECIKDADRLPVVLRKVGVAPLSVRGGLSMSDVVVEVVTPVSRGGDLSARRVNPESFDARSDELASGLARIAERFRRRVDELVSTGGDGARLEQVQLQFGLALQAESGMVIAKAAVGTTFTATLTWSARRPELTR